MQSRCALFTLGLVIGVPATYWGYPADSRVIEVSTALGCSGFLMLLAYIGVVGMIALFCELLEFINGGN